MEQQRRAVDLEKLRFMEVSQRREIALLDMIGEYGAKVGCKVASATLTFRSISLSSIYFGSETTNRTVGL